MVFLRFQPTPSLTYDVFNQPLPTTYTVNTGRGTMN